MKNIKFICYGLIVALSAFFSCSEMDDTYMEFVKDGEIQYSKRVDSVAVYSGKNRIKLSFVNLGPKVAKVKIYWNHKAESFEAPVESTDGRLDVIIPDLAEGVYSFDIYTFDKLGNISVPHTVIGKAYGESYNNTLRLREIEISNIDKNDIASVDWFTSPSGAISTEVKYVDNMEADQTVYVPSDEGITYLPDYVEGRLITYRTLFLPEENAIDTFYSETSTRKIIKVPMLVDKSLFANVKITGDDWEAHGGNSSWNIERAWDNIYYVENPLFHATRTGFPSYITIDIGTLTKLTHMKMWSRVSGKFDRGHIKEFELYGRADAPDLNDDSLAGWTKIMNGVSVKPSGLPLGQTNEEDRALLEAGEDFQFDPNAEPVRYIRMKVLDNWGTDTYWYIGEINLWGFEQ
jgi:hypothetical protein